MSQLARAMTEGQLLDAIVQAAKLHGWMVAHFRPALTAKGWRTPMQGDPGFPDLILAKKGRHPIFLELKAERGKVSDAQYEWLDALGRAFIAEVVRPSDLDQVLLWLD